MRERRQNVTAEDLAVRQVNVTARDVARGLPRRTAACPVARAVRRLYGVQDVDVGVTVVCIDGVNYSIPPEAQKFIVDIDMDVRPRPRPIKFWIERMDME